MSSIIANLNAPVTQASPFLDLPKEILVEIAVIGLQNGCSTVLKIALLSKEMPGVARIAITRIFDRLEQSIPQGLLRRQIAFLPFEVKDLNDKEGLAFLRFASLKAKILSMDLSLPKNFLVNRYLKLHKIIMRMPSYSRYYPGGTNLTLFWRWNGMQVQHERDENLIRVWKGNERSGIHGTGLWAKLRLALWNPFDTAPYKASQKLRKRIPGLQATAQDIREFLHSNRNRCLINLITLLKVPREFNLTALPFEIASVHSLSKLTIEGSEEGSEGFTIKALPEQMKELTYLRSINIPSNMAVPPEIYERLQKRKLPEVECYIG